MRPLPAALLDSSVPLHYCPVKQFTDFLAPDASAFIAGALIPMDGGNLSMNGGGAPIGAAKK